jgi:sensor histidine kinase YesM
MAQKHHSTHYTAADVLPNNTVRSLLLDSQGVLWIGTDNGLVKKENNRFTSFFEEDGLAQNNIWTIKEDSNEQLWFGSFGGGVSIFDGHEFKVITKKEGLVHNDVTTLFLFNNFMCVGTYNGVSLIDINTHKIFSAVPITVKPFKISSFFTYKNQLYCNTVWTGLYQIQIEKEKIKLSSINKQQNSIAFFQDKDTVYNSQIGFFTKTTLKNYISSNTFSANKWGHSILWDYVKDAKNRIFAAAGGLYTNDGSLFEIVDNQLISRAEDYNIESKNLLALAYDKRFQKLYVGTGDQGLYEVLLEDAIKFTTTASTSILGFDSTTNSQIFLTNDGLHIDYPQQKIHISQQQFKDWQQHFITTTKKPLPKYEDYFYEIDYQTPAKDLKFYDLKKHQNQLWINTNIGLYALDVSGNLIQYLPVHTEEFNFTPEGELIETNPYHGLRIYQSIKDFTYRYYDEKEANTPTMVVNSLQKGHKTYLLSIFTGLYVWKDGQFTSYLKNNIWSESKLRHITSLGNHLAISTEFGDVFIINDNDDFKVLTKIPRAQINGNTISFLNQYQGFLLIGTEKGLTIYKDQQFIFVNHEQGLLQPFTAASVKDHILFIGNKNGYYRVNLDAFIQPKKRIHALKLSELTVNNEAFPISQLTNDGIVRLAYHQNTIKLHFTTNAHPFPDKLSYQYRLNDENEWSAPSTISEIYLTHLNVKKYKIQVKVLDQSTGFSYTQNLIQLNISSPFWKTWWFILLMIGLIFGVAYSLYRYQLHQNQQFEAQKSLIEKRVESIKLEALLAQMNPHFIFNALNSVQSYIMDQDIKNASFYLGEFAQLIRKNLEYCTQPTILLVEELDYLKSFIGLENLRYQNKIEVHFEVDPQLDIYEIEIPSMLFQPFVENVFVHAFPPRILNPILHIHFKLLSPLLMECVITDNGTGIVKTATDNQLHQSKGLTLVRERLQLLGYSEDTLCITSVKDQGTIVDIQLQL